MKYFPLIVVAESTIYIRGSLIYIVLSATPNWSKPLKKRDVAYVEKRDVYRAMADLEGIYVKPRNIVAARHELRSCEQQPGETTDQNIMTKI